MCPEKLYELSVVSNKANDQLSVVSCISPLFGRVWDPLFSSVLVILVLLILSLSLPSTLIGFSPGLYLFIRSPGWICQITQALSLADLGGVRRARPPRVQVLWF